MGEHITMKVWRSTKKRLRVLAAQQDTSIVKLMDKLISDEEKRVKDNGKKD